MDATATPWSSPSLVSLTANHHYLHESVLSHSHACYLLQENKVRWWWYTKMWFKNGGFLGKGRRCWRKLMIWCCFLLLLLFLVYVHDLIVFYCWSIVVSYFSFGIWSCWHVADVVVTRWKKLLLSSRTPRGTGTRGESAPWRGSGMGRIWGCGDREQGGTPYPALH